MKLKVLLTLAASLTAFHAMADCLGDICSGERVINRNNEISTVVAINELDSKVITKNSYQQIREYSASELSDEISSEDLPSGKLIIDDYNIQGTVNVVFRNGQVVYRRQGYSSDSISQRVSPEVSEYANLRAGVRILDDYNIKGEIKKLFKNGNIFYRRDGYSSDTLTANSKSLITKSNNFGELSKNTQIIDDYNIMGSVTDIYADGRIFYRRSGYSSDTLTANPKTLVLKVTSVNGLIEGTSIIDDYNITGSVTNLYKDGRVFYRRSGYSSDTMTQGNKLVKEVSQLGERFKKGTFAIDSYNIPGRVESLFADGRMIFKRNGYSSSNVVTELFEEVATHKQYSKELRYATENLKIGNPTNFFSNGLVLHEGSVVSELFESVENFEGINSDSELTSILGRSFKAQELFANGIVVLNDKNATVSRITIYSSLKNNENLLQNLGYRLSEHVQNDRANYVDSISLLPSELALIKQDLIVSINKSQDYYLNKDIKKKILVLLASVIAPGESDIQDPEEYALSVTPVSIIDDVKAILDQDQKKYIFVSPSAASQARKSIIVDISKGLLKSTCSIVIKERNIEIKNVNKKIGKKDTEECLIELKD